MTDTHSEGGVNEATADRIAKALERIADALDAVVGDHEITVSVRELWDCREYGGTDDNEGAVRIKVVQVP